MSTGSPKAIGKSGPKIRVGRRNLNWPKRENWLTAERVTFGTSGTKRRDPAGSAEMRNFVPEQLGQKGANRPNWVNLPQTVRSKWDIWAASTRTDRTGRNGNKQSETTGTFGTNGREPSGLPEISTRITVLNGTKGRAGREKPKWPKAGKKSQ
ncbi:hypothetical protein KI387_000754, partial [Taxus chinensis]